MGHTVAEVYSDQFLADWQDITSIRKPIIAAVSGYAVRPLPFPPNPLTLTPARQTNSSAAGANLH
jgi:hypothetical protein